MAVNRIRFYGRSDDSMSALGQKRIYAVQQGMYALLLKADIFGGRSEAAPQRFQMVARLAERSEPQTKFSNRSPEQPRGRQRI